MYPQSPAAGDAALDVKVTVLVDVPLATNVPSTSSTFPLSNFTVTPGSIVNVTPDATVTLPVTVYGLSATAHVVLEEIVPDTEVAADTGEMEKNARSKDRPMRMARRGPTERSVRKVLAMNLGMSVCPMSWSPGC